MEINTLRTICFFFCFFVLVENYKSKSKAKKDQTTPRNEKEFKNITQRENETDMAYLRRVNRITHESAQEAKFEAKYGVEVVRNKKTGEIKLKKRPTNEIDERLKQNMENHRRAKKSGQAVDATTPAVVLSSDERKKMVKKMMAEKKAAKMVVEPTKDFKKDEFKFGEVVHAPPTLTTPRRAKKAETVPRVICLVLSPLKFPIDSVWFQPGKKSLLLNSMLENNSGTAMESEVKSPTEKPKASKNVKNIGSLKGKRKDMSMAMRHMIEMEQYNVVKMYKEMKKSQRLESAASIAS